MKNPGNGALVSLRNLSRSYLEGQRRHDVIRHLCIDIQPGETIALRGRSGSGKSTLLNLISGIDAPDEGDVVVAGRTITGMSERERTLFRREHIGFVYQAFNLVPTLSVADNVRLVLELNEVPDGEAQERVFYLLESVGLADRHDSYPDVLSGGEQQRVAIARAFATQAHEPSLLLADEPTGNLDGRNAERVLGLLDELARRSKRTMIIATHSANVAAFADRVLELQDGVLRS